MYAVAMRTAKDAQTTETTSPLGVRVKPTIVVVRCDQQQSARGEGLVQLVCVCQSNQVRANGNESNRCMTIVLSSEMKL